MNETILERERILELGDLVVFKTVAEVGSITRAGERLHRVQSNVTARVKRLEGQLGVSLFVRGRRGMSLTPEGKRLMEYADRLLELAEEAQTHLGSREPSGRLEIGSMESTAAVHLPQLLARLHDAYPALDVQLGTGTSGALISRLRAGEVSVVFVSGDVDEPGLVAEPAFMEELVIITHPSMRRGPRPGDLRGRTLVSFSAGCTYRACMETWLAQNGIRPPRTFEVASYHAMLACIAANVGYAFAPKSVLRASSAGTAVIAHRIGHEPWRMTTWLVRRANDRSRAVDALADLVRRGARRLSRGENGVR